MPEIKLKYEAREADIALKRLRSPVEIGMRRCPLFNKKWLPDGISVLRVIPVPVAYFRKKYWVLTDWDWARVVALQLRCGGDQSVRCLVWEGLSWSEIEAIYNTSWEVVLSSVPRHHERQLADAVRNARNEPGIRRIEKGFDLAPGALAPRRRRSRAK